jgi:Arrestin (or S-antigen), N-terminal domain
MATSLEIQLENSPLVFMAGDKVKGKVILHATDDVAVGSVSIIFSGRGKTKLTRRHGNHRVVYRGRAPLFIHKKRLYEGHYKMKADRYVWDFEFTFPSHSDPTICEDSFGACGVWRKTYEKHMLPPTFKYYDNFSKNQGMVEYKLEALLLRPNHGLLSSKLESSRELVYQPTRTQVEPDRSLRIQENMFKLRTLMLLPDKAPLTFKEKMHSFFKPDNLPTVNFIVQMGYPTVTYPGRPVHFRLAVVSMNSSEEVTELPAVILNGITIRIKTGYFFRAACMTGFREGALESEAYFINRPNNLQVELPRVQVPGKSHAETRPQRVTSFPETHLDVATLHNGAFVTPRVDPTFSTINVAVTHRIKIKMTMTCVDKKFTYECIDNLLVLPSHVNRSSLEAVAREEVEPLPLYTRTSMPIEGSDAIVSSPGVPMEMPGAAELPAYTRTPANIELPAYSASEVRV